MTKCKSLQSQGDIPNVDSNTSIGLSFTPGDVLLSFLIFKHFSHDLKALCKL